MKSSVAAARGRWLVVLAMLALAGCSPTAAVSEPTVGGTTDAAPTTMAPTAAGVSTLTVTPTLAAPIPVTSTAAGTASPSVVPTMAVTPVVSETAPLTATGETSTAAGGGAQGSQGLSVTLADVGKSLALHVGDRFLVNLGADYNWDVNVVDSSVVGRVIGITVIRGAQGVYEARRAGTTTLEVTGDPLCRQAQPPCGMPSREFTVKLVVQ